MKRSLLCSLLIGSFSVIELAIAPAVLAQIVPDGSLSTTVRSRDGRNFSIENGDRVGGNLFHSFREFSVPTGGAAVFNHAADVQNIFSRVTGSAVSNIDGLLRANGRANLFLLNPNGIIFGANARLAISGSFVGTTANRMQFADGTVFSANLAESSPALTLSVPMGLQFGSPVGTPVGTIINRSQAPGFRGPAGLQVVPGRSIALIGGDVRFESGLMTASAGRIDLGSVGAGSTVALTSVPQGFGMNYDEAQNFGTISLVNGASANTTGTGAGSIQVQAAQIRLINLSALTANTTGALPGGSIAVRATDLVEIDGNSPDVSVRTGITATVLPGATGRGSNIAIETRRLRVQDGFIASGLLGQGDAGMITIKADDILLARNPALTRTTPSRLAVGVGSTVLPGATGRGGDIRIESDRIRIESGALIASGTFSSGESGNIQIRANQIDILGIDPLPPVTSSISTSSILPTATGNSGNLRVEVGNLRLLNGGEIAAMTEGSGNAGDIVVDARSIEVAGVSVLPRRGDRFPSTISAAALQTTRLSPETIAALPGIQAPAAGQSAVRGAAGSVTLRTDRLIVRRGGNLSVSNQGRSGNAGDLNVIANQLVLDRGTLEARVRAGNQGNVNVTVNSGTIELRNGSRIVTNAQGQATGGNITLTANYILATDNSDITANAEDSFGGQVSINAQGVFGTEFRSQTTTGSDITASSERGAEFSGTVDFNTAAIDPSQGLIELPETVMDADTQMTAACGNRANNSFIVTGRGGMPENPTGAFRHDRPWADLRDLAIGEARSIESASTQPTPVATAPLAEVTGWRQTANGQIELIAIAPHATPVSPAACWSDRHSSVLE